MNYQPLLSDETRLDIFGAFLWYEGQRKSCGVDDESGLEADPNKVQRNLAVFQIQYNTIQAHFIDRFLRGIYRIPDLTEDVFITVMALFLGHKDSSPRLDHLESQ